MTEKGRIYQAIGLMSGTSHDGVDAALVRTDGETFIKRLDFHFVPYPPEIRQKIREIMGWRPERAGDVRLIEIELTNMHVRAVLELLKMADVTAGHVDVIGFHGQTILHKPSEHFSWQIGDGALMAEETGIDVVNDFRTADVKAGGQGAPLVPLYHQVMCATLRERPVAVLNIGGVANVTWVGAGKQDILAFDTGPGCALIDDWMFKKTGKAVDRDGIAARAGKVRQDLIDGWLRHPHFALRPPKSLDRNAFSSAAVDGLSVEDGAATLAAFTAQSVVLGTRFFSEQPKRWLVTGGGRLNPAIMNNLRELLGVPVEPVEALGWNGDAVEAEAFAYLAVRSLKKLPLTLPTTTGIKGALTGGVLHKIRREAAHG